jgi:hypothetical protein
MTALAEKVFRVTAEYVVLKVATPNGINALGFYRDALVTGLTDQVQADHHLNFDPPLIEEVKATAAVKAQAQGGEDKLPAPEGPPDPPADPPAVKATGGKAGAKA